MILRAIGVGVLLLGCAVGRAAAQTAADAAAAVALTAEQEKTMAGQAQGVTRAALGTVMGAVRGAVTAVTAPAAAAPAAAAPAAAVPAPAAVAALQVPKADDPVPIDGAEFDAAAGGAMVVAKGRDPFRPFTLDLRPSTQENQILTPLQRYELPQLRLAGVVLDLRPPRAMLQDNSGMGFIVTPGTPIGRRRGVVKAIESRRVVVEEHVLDYYGREQIHDVVIEMPKEDKPQSAGQERP